MIFSFLDDESIFSSASRVSRTWQRLICTSKVANDWLWLPRSRYFFPCNSSVNLDEQWKVYTAYAASMREVLNI